MFNPAANSNQKYAALNVFLTGLGLEKDSLRKNIINNKEAGGSYHLEGPKQIKTFFDKYEQCRLQGEVELSIQESMRSMFFTGIVLDFDILTETKMTIKTAVLVDTCFRILVELLEVAKLKKTKVFVTKKPDVVKTPAGIRDGIHIIFPSIRVSSGFKAEYLKRLVRSKKLIDFFERRLNDMNELIDQHMSLAQIYLFGSSKPSDHNPYELIKVFELTFEDDTVSSSLLKDYDSDNLALEMSILYASEKDYKSPFDVATVIKPKKDNETKLAELRYADPRVNYLLNLIDLIDPQIFVATTTWKTFIKAIANIDVHFKPIAVYGSQKAPTEFNLPKTMNLIDQCFINDDHEKDWGMGKIINWVKEYNPDEYMKIKVNNICEIAKNDTFHCEGRITDDRIAKLLRSYYSGLYVTSYNESDKKKQWFKMETEHAHAFKWQRFAAGEVPPILEQNIASDIYGIFKDALAMLTAKRDEKPIEAILKNLKNFLLATENYTRKNQIMKTLQGFLNVDDFIENLDQHPLVLGVNGGVLLISDQKGIKPELIRAHNNYNVSINTKRNYIEYDPENPDIKDVYEVLQKGFYINKKKDKARLGYDKEAFDYVMFHYAQGLSSGQKKPIMLNLFGGGGNLKSTLLVLVQNTFGIKKTISFKAEYLSEPMPSPEDFHPNAIQMIGKNYISFTENDRGRTLNEGKLKWLLSPSEMKTARTLHKDMSQFMIHGVNTVYTNWVLEIDGTDDGVWRRQRYLRMKRVFKENPDPKKPWESKDNSFIIEHWVKKESVCDAFLSILTYYYYILINEYGGNINKVPQSAITKLTTKIRENSDMMTRFIKDTLVPIHPNKIGNSGFENNAADAGEDENDSNDSTSEEDPIKIEVLAQQYIKWDKLKNGTKILVPKVVIEKLNKSSLKFKDDILVSHKFK